jgi:hypothetical protein
MLNMLKTLIITAFALQTSFAQKYIDTVYQFRKPDPDTVYYFYSDKHYQHQQRQRPRVERSVNGLIYTMAATKYETGYFEYNWPDAKLVAKAPKGKAVVRIKRGD